jgi:predicted nucleotidyltransferase
MQFREFTRKALGSEGRVRVMLYLFRNSAPASEREIARMLSLSNTAVNKTMKDFYDINLVTPMRVGSAQVWRMNEGSYAYGALRDMGSLAARQPIDDLKERIAAALRGRAKMAVIFGSVAEGREQPSSDIDLFVLISSESDRKPVLEALESLSVECMKLYGNQLSPTVMTEKEAKEPGKQKLTEAARRGISVI